MATTIIAVTGQKGGSGKSTAAISCAVEWQVRGRRVLLVDADPQGSATAWAEVASEASRQPPTVIAMGATMHRDGQLARVAEGFDLVLVDCPPKHDAIARSALMCCDLALLPCGPGATDAWALSSSVELVREAMALRPGLQAAVLLTRKQASTVFSRTARAVFEGAGLPVLRTELGLRVAFVEALAAGLGATTYASGDVAALEIRKLCDEIEQLVAVHQEEKIHVA